MNRRNALKLGLAGLSLPNMLQAQYGLDVKAKNIIYIYLTGGISAQESFDPKPLAPSEYRGPFSAIKTKTDGLLFSEMFPKLAKQTDKFSVIKSMTHGSAAHELATSYMLTGYRPSPALKYPSLGSTISNQLGVRANLPPYITIPNTPNESYGSGFLSSKYNPFALGSDPASSKFVVRDLQTPEGKNEDRRRNILELVDSEFNLNAKSDNVDAINEFYKQAYALISSSKAVEAFDLSKESDAIRDAYGRSTGGSRMLMARRLIEAGTRIVKLTYGSFDMHDNIKKGFQSQAPNLDKGLAYLFEDLDERGLLDETLVVVTSEFGRTPKGNPTNGRDHFSRVFSTIVGGGGIKNGIVHGSSGSLSMEVDEKPVSPEDLYSTIYTLAGINPQKEVMTADLRPVKINRGSVIKGLV